jgi:hypothetical protein
LEQLPNFHVGFEGTLTLSTNKPEDILQTPGEEAQQEQLEQIVQVEQTRSRQSEKAVNPGSSERGDVPAAPEFPGMHFLPDLM